MEFLTCDGCEDEHNWLLILQITMRVCGFVVHISA